jgi:hypothetical protein
MNDVPANLIRVGVILAKVFVISRLLFIDSERFDSQHCDAQD